MKKLFLLAASALMVLASCRKTDIVYQNETPQEIGLFSVAKKQTKAAIDGTEFTHDNMAVTAYLAKSETGGNKQFFGKTVFSNNGTVFTGGKYWPLEDCAINFLAIAPETTNQIVTTFNINVATVNVSENQTHQNDVMYAVGRGVKIGDTAPDNVDMVFYHALAWINFEFLGSNQITIDKIIVNGAKYNGSFTATSANWATDIAQDTPSIEWSGDETINNIEVKGDKIQLSNSPATWGKSNNTTGGLLVRPCKATNFIIHYTVNTGSESHSYTYTYEPAEWGMGAKYTYKINMSLQEIKIEPQVNPWIDNDLSINLN